MPLTCTLLASVRHSPPSQFKPGVYVHRVFRRFLTHPPPSLSLCRDHLIMRDRQRGIERQRGYASDLGALPPPIKHLFWCTFQTEDHIAFRHSLCVHPSLFFCIATFLYYTHLCGLGPLSVNYLEATLYNSVNLALTDTPCTGWIVWKCKLTPGVRGSHFPKVSYLFNI